MSGAVVALTLAGITVAGITVAVPASARQSGRSTSPHVELFPVGQRDEYTARPRRDGAYTARDLPAGDYVVCFSSSHFRSECYQNQPWRGRRLPSGTTQVHVTGGAATSGIDAVLEHR